MKYNNFMVERASKVDNCKYDFELETNIEHQNDYFW